MDIKKIVVIAALALLAIIGFNYYSSAQSEKARAARVAETEALRASIPQPTASVQQPTAVIEAPEINQPQLAAGEPAPIASDNELFSAAVPEEAELKNKLDDSFCDSIIPVAEKIMRGRLNGVSIASSLEVVNGIKDGTPANEAVSDLTKQIVIQAYDTPSFSTESYKDDAIREFGAKQYLACMKAFS